MSAEPLQQAINVCREVMSNVTPEQMENATPCASWNVGQLINHMVDAQSFFVAGMEGQEPQGGDTNWAAGDWQAQFNQNADASIACFSAEGAMQKMVAMPFGEMPGGAVMGLALNDTFTHAWDLAKATGQSTDLAPELAQGILAQARESIQDAFRGPEGAPFGAEAECPEGACAADQLAAFLGRQV